jgi:hypothetical protein
MEGRIEGYGSAPWRLYSFLSGDAERVHDAIEHGPVPWFAHPEAKVDFFRPLNSALLNVDYLVFGREAWGYRLQSCIWYAILVALFARVLGKSVMWSGTGGRRAVVFLAPVLVAFSASHWQNVMYTASRWVLISAALSLLGLLAHLRWRREGWRPGRPLSLGACALAMLAYLLAFELMGAAGMASRCRGGASTDGLDGAGGGRFHAAPQRLAAGFPAPGRSFPRLVRDHCLHAGALGVRPQLPPHTAQLRRGAALSGLGLRSRRCRALSLVR